MTRNMRSAAQNRTLDNAPGSFYVNARRNKKIKDYAFISWHLPLCLRFKGAQRCWDCFAWSVLILSTFDPGKINTNPGQKANNYKA